MSFHQDVSESETAFYMCGSKTKNLTECRIRRHSLAETFRSCGFEKSADHILHVDWVKALSGTASRRGKPLANRAARAVSTQTERVVIDVLPIPAAKKAIAFEVKRGRWSDTEECGTDLAIGARILANGDGVFALPPRPEDGGESAADPVCMEVARAIENEARESVSYVTTNVVSTAFSLAYRDANTYPGVCDGARVAVAGTAGTEQLRLLKRRIKAQHYDGLNGIRLNMWPIPRVPEAQEQWGDTVLHTVAAEAEEMAKSLATSKGTAKATTIERSRERAQGLLDTIRENQSLLGDWAEKLKKRADAIRTAYENAAKGMALELPSWFEDTDPAKGSGTPEPEPEPEPEPKPVRLDPAAVMQPIPREPEPEPEPEPEDDMFTL